MTLPRLISCMLDPEIYPHPADHVELIQTHISFVLLAGSYAYKIKKPVNLGFLDFSTLDKRRFMCREEVRLNRRLAPDVYLEVVPVYQGGPCGASLSQPDGAQPAEYAVKMRRLSEDTMLPALLRSSQAHEEMVRALGRKLADFHASVPEAPPDVTEDAFDLVRRNFEENFVQISSLIGSELDRDRFRLLEQYVRWFLRSHRDLFQQRADEARIRECHGDLRMEHVCFDQGRIIIFDCIEFNTRFRCIDTAEDLAFLLMDMEFNGYWNEARTLASSYQDQAGDRSMDDLLTFFKAYYAMTRGKVSAIQSTEDEFSQEDRGQALKTALAYFDLAHDYAIRIERPVLIFMCGLTGTGKSSLARDLAADTGAEVLRSDELRKQLAGVDRSGDHRVPFGQGIYSREWTRKTYAALVEQGAQRLKSGRPVILDASFLEREHRAMAKRTAAELQVPLVCLHCVCPREVARQRLAERELESGEVSDGRWEIYTAQEARFEALSDLDEANLVTIPTERGTKSPAEDALQGLLGRIRS
jgi:hypothetical protein